MVAPIDIHAETVRRLYLKMPDAPPPPNDDGLPLWGEVENNKHWQFCEQIAAEIISASAMAYRRSA